MGESEPAIRRDPSRHFPKLKKVRHRSDWEGLSDSLRLCYFKALCAMPEWNEGRSSHGLTRYVANAIVASAYACTYRLKQVGH